MKKFVKICTVGLLGLAFGCGTEPDTNSTDNPISPTDSTSTSTGTEVEQPVKPNCELSGKPLDENVFWAKNENLLVAITAPPETNDPDFGESHRLLEVYDGNNCNRVMREVLPVNLSPDYPYYLAEINYNNVNQLLAIKGLDKFYIFDLKNRKLTGPIVPKFLNERIVEDAAAGNIQRLEVWEDFIIGHAQGMGAFVFNLGAPQKPLAILPFAEYKMRDGTGFNSLFLLASSDEANGSQAILPKYDYESGVFTIGAVFQKPLKIETQMTKSARNNRYIVLKELIGETDSRAIGIDMEKMQKIDLPDEVAKMKVTEVVEWMKKN